MNISVRATSVKFDDDLMWVGLDDGRAIGVPIAWYPRLLHASAADRAKAWISPTGLHWDEIDEDISIEGLLAGRGDMTRAPRHAA